ncbi:28S ribosomal protein S17, mitochondrial [Camponotus floridanus]|uniref:28S ribosomal protein S17, mitochondrial n=1 Tax=Camponotus floridanus TaxID=104421 RepID=E2AXU0_CAMFO|nr:28S ribosomal protein S17, mitochondrial [Camponotus floridanus]XP_025262310.1 28S ribosomal protein S17, mitochondrial [Camponotus floridanus]XP_025262311.1 28S ribosomal protein S17, mitochondrial [Camponotus floridanus]EFN61748.1 28S ribosomal protein S17, mitochondrial [Camponotus floridanus]
MVGGAARASKTALRYLLGTCVPSSKQNAAKVRISQLEFNDHIHMHYKKYDFVYANDPKKLCKTGDVILIKELSNKLTRLISHEVIEVIYPLGDITDPVTGKKIVASQYREDIDEADKLLGKKDSVFDYSKAPKRGRLEGVRDFTHKKMYLKYYDDPHEPQPDTVY